MKAKSQKRGFKGIWIPKEIWLNENLTLQEKVFLVEIDSLNVDNKGCYASNEYFAKFFGLSRKRVSFVINELIKKAHLKSEINQAAGNKRTLTALSPKAGIPLSPETGIPYPRKQGYPIPENEARYPRKRGYPHYKEDNKPNTKIDNKDYNNSNVVFSPEKVLDLDLKITQARNFFCSQIEKIFHLTAREKKTFLAVTKYLVAQCQTGELDVSIFKDAIEWARQAMASGAANKKGLFIAKIKQETGFRKTKGLLQRAAM